MSFASVSSCSSPVLLLSDDVAGGVGRGLGFAINRFPFPRPNRRLLGTRVSLFIVEDKGSGEALVSSPSGCFGCVDMAFSTEGDLEDDDAGAAGGDLL